MTTTIEPKELFFGAPVSLTYGGVEVGGTIDPPKVTITPTVYVPEFQNAKGPIVGTAIVTRVEVAAEFTVNQFTAAKLAWAMPGCETVGDTTTWEPGRVPSDAYKDLVLIGEGLDGRSMVIAIHNALSTQPLEIDFSATAVAGMKVRMMGYYDADAPTVAPFSIELDLGS
jgi:hypothetical protein